MEKEGRILPNRQQKIQTESVFSLNKAGGKAVFIPEPIVAELGEVPERNLLESDMKFIDNPVLKTDLGKFNSIHKIKDGKHIYFFSNSSDEEMVSEVVLRGKLKLESRNPHNGNITALNSAWFVNEEEHFFTKCTLKLTAVSSMSWLGEE